MSHWKNNRELLHKISQRICTQTKTIRNQETSLCIHPEASLTIEASVVVPLMAGFLAIILFFFRIMQVQAIVEETLIYTGRCVAVESSVVSSEEALYLSAEGIFRTVLAENETINRYVENGSWGISLYQSEFAGDEICLRAEYAVKLPVDFFFLDRIALYSENVFQKWIGNKGQTVTGNWVYITQTGSVYHTDINCRALDISVKAVFRSEIDSYRGADGQKYYACKACVKGTSAVVYYTDYGTLFHNDVKCSALKRTIKKVKLEEVGSRRICRFCATR